MRASLVFTAKRLSAFSILSLMLLAGFLFMVPKPVNAGSVVVAQATGCASCSSSATLTFPSVIAGDGFVLAAMEGPSANYPTFPAAGNGEVPVSKLTDAIGGNDGNYQLRVSTFVALSSGSETVTATYTSTTATFFVAYQVRGINVTVVASATTGGGTNHEPVVSFSGTIPANGFTMGLGYTTDSSSQSWSIGASNTASPSGVLVCDTCTRKGASEYVLNAGSSYTFDLNGAAGTFSRMQLAAFAPLPSSVNTQCIGSCSGSPSGSNYIVSKRMYFAQAINGVSVSSNLYNITSNINHVHVTTATASFTLAVYSVPGGSAPTASTPFLLLWSFVFSITNSSDVGQVITNTPNVPICANCYYAVALFTNANASRGSGASNSGISVPTSGLSYTQYFFGVGSSSHVVPSSFSSSSTTTPALYLKGLSQFALVTTTVTSTLSGTVSSTVTVTSTTLDAALAAQGTAADSIILLMILLPAFAVMIPMAAYTKSAPAAGIGFVAGAMIGAGAGVQAQLVPPVFLGVMLIVGIFIIVGLWKTGGP